MTAPPAWVNDSGIRWRILLTARLDELPAPTTLQDRLDLVCDEHAWTRSRVVTDDSSQALRVALAEALDPVVVGTAGDRLVISAHHAHVDGLGLLTLLGLLTGVSVASTARGVADRDERPGGFAGAAARRLGEVLLAPPAAVALAPRPDRAGDVLVERDVEATMTSADLVIAAVAAVMAVNQRAGRRSRHVSVAVGAGRPVDPADADRIADRSALIRLRNLEDADEAEVRRLLRSAPLEPSPSGGAAGGRFASTAMRLLQRRLGSTMLVSHLGTVTAPGVSHLAFHPVTAGRTGLSLGAVALDGRTTLGLRTRAANAGPAELAALLDEIAGRSGA